MQTATNPSTGETVVLVDNAWQKAEKTATGENGSKAYLVGGKWLTADQPKAKAPSLLQTAVNYHPVVGGVETAANLASGMAGTVAGGISGIATGLTNQLGLTNTEPGDRVRQVQEAMTYQPRTDMGKGITNAITAIPRWAGERAESIGGNVTDAAANAGASPSIAADLGTKTNVALQAIPAIIGRGVRTGAAVESPAAVVARASEKSLNTPMDQAIALARQNEIKLTPTQAGAGTIARNAEGLVGSERLQKAQSKQNAPMVNNLIRRDVGLADDAPLTRETLAGIRAEAGKKYDAVKQAGEVTTDLRYKADLDGIVKDYDTAAKSFSHRSENPFKKTLDGLRTDKFDAASAVEEVKLLRADADKAFRTGDPGLGRAYKRAAQTVDDMLDRHLTKMSAVDPSLANAVAEYKQARVQISKAYAAEKALIGDTGDINVGVYARELDKGKPLSGDARTVAVLGRQFPKAFQNVSRVGNTDASYADALAGAVAAHSMGPAGMLAAAVRPVVRTGLLSNFAQEQLTRPTQYGRPITGRLAELLAEGDYPAGAAFTAAGQRR